ncbi:MAG: pyocin knob domain-containing protein [bacterium]
MSEKLKVDYRDDIITDGEPLRKYNMISNSDGTVSFVDTTSYEQNGDIFGCDDINLTNTKVNEIEDNQNIKSISLDSIGMTTDSKLIDICNAMPNNSKTSYFLSALPSGSDYPQAYSVVEILRMNVTRTRITCSRSDGSGNDTYINTWRSDVGLSGWSRYAVTDNLFGTTISNLDTVSGMGIYYTTANPISFPSGLGGNGCVVINTAMSSSNYAVQLAFGFGSDKIAIRRKNGSTTWTSWRYTTLSSAS